MESQLMNLSVVEENTLVQQHEQNKNEKNIEDDDDKIRPWVDLPSELLNLIFSSLFDPDHISFSSIRDQIAFRLTCKGWQSSVRCRLPGRQFPILMSLNPPRESGIFTFFNPIITNKEIQVFDDCMEWRKRDHIHCFRFGWLLISREYKLFLYNPFIPGSATVKLPILFRLPYIQRIDSMSFTAPPTSSECIVYVHDIYDPSKPGNKVGIYRWCYGDDYWTDYHIECQSPFRKSCGNPILYKSVFYQLNKCGRLGISDPKKGNEQHIWKDLPRPKPLKNTIYSPPYTKKRKQQIIAQEERVRTRNYMAECDGKLVMVHVEYKNLLFLVHSVHIFELDWSRMEWVTVQSLGNKAMFICDTESLLIKTNGGGVENKIYFPAFVNTEEDGVDGCRATKRICGVDGRATKKVGVFYCLENRKYNFLPEYWKAVVNCIWIDTDGGSPNNSDVGSDNVVPPPFTSCIATDRQRRVVKKPLRYQS